MAGPNDNEEEDKRSFASSDEDDKVAAAYENISKKLENIRNGRESGDEENEDENPRKDDEEDLEEWKGPKPVDLEEEEEEIELRKVKLEHSEGDDEDKHNQRSDDSEDDEDEKPLKKWEPEENDPLDDEEDSEDLKQNLRSDDSEEEKEEREESDSSEDSERDEEEKDNNDEERKPHRDFEPEKFENDTPVKHSEGDESEEADEDEKPKTAYFGEDVKPRHDFERAESEETFRRQPSPDTLDDLADKPSDEEDDYHIPNLRGSRHQQAGMEYNAPPSGPRMNRPFGNHDSMENSDPNNYFSQHQQGPKRANKFHLLILVVIGIIVIGFTVYILKGGFGEINITTSPSPSPSAQSSVEPTPTPTPEPTIERGDFTIRVLNGTSTTGLAGTVTDKLEELGYKTANPGNATNSAFTQTVIRVKDSDDAQALFERLKLDLSSDYDATQGTLPDSSANDAEVILGKN